MVSDQAPVMSVVVEYRLPVSVFCAVTVTPGSGMLPLFTWPCSLPPVTACPDGTCPDGACGAVPVAGALAAAPAGLAGTGVCGAACAHAAKPPATTIPIANAHRPARRLRAPRHLVLVLSQTAHAPRRFTMT